MKYFKATLVLVPLLAGFANLAPAQTSIVNWGGNYVSATQNLNAVVSESNVTFGGDGGTTDRRKGTDVAGLLTNTLQPSSGYSGTNGTLYGGFEYINVDTGTPIISNFSQRIRETAALDLIQFGGGTGIGGAGGAMTAVFLWKQSDFLSLNTGSVTFDGSSSLSFRFGPFGGYSGAGFDGRFVVQDGGGFWLSSSMITGASNTTTTLNNPGSVTWAPINFSGAYLNQGLAGATYAAHTFADIVAVGVYLESDGLTSGNSVSQTYAIESFSATATAVPEPSTYAVFAGLTMLGFAVYRRRRA